MKKSELITILKKSIKSTLTEYKIKSRGGTYYKIIGEYFLTILVNISGYESDQVTVMVTLKPMIIDDIFWKVFDMSDNSNAPVGLRANGAFTVDGYRMFYENRHFSNVEEIGKISSYLIKESIVQSEKIVDTFSSPWDFLNYTKAHFINSLYDVNLIEMLLLINEKQYSKAKVIAQNLINNDQYGRFENNGKYIYEHIIDCCENNKE